MVSSHSFRSQTSHRCAAQPQFLLAGAFVLLCSLIPALSLTAQEKPAKVQKSPPKAVQKRSTSGQDELDNRLAAARTARDSRDPSAAARANKLVISLALKQLGRLRLFESAYPQPVEISPRSLHFDHMP